jgi:hypothetical protein
MRCIWKDIKGYEGLYQCSDKGEIKRLEGVDSWGRYKAEVILKPRTTKKNEYARCSLSKDGIVNGYRVHRIIAETFIPNPENKPTVNHINGKRNDNRVCNLEWATSSEQNYHMWKTGLIKISDKWVEAMKKANIGKKHSNETKLKISNANKGNIAWNKGMTKQQEYEYRMAKNN